MFSYKTKYAQIGMIGKNEVLGNWQGYRKNCNAAVSYFSDFSPDYKQINYAYIYEKPEKYNYKLTQLTSNFNEEFFKLEGKKYREIRETKNHLNKIVIIKDYNKEDTLKLIKTWDKFSGEKYGFQRRSARDSNFFKRWFDLERDNLFSRFYYIGNEMLGYSVLHNEGDYWNYLIRKTNISLGRNTCLYVDYKTFEEIFAKENKEFFVNWGGSSGSLLKYKRKFPRYEEVPVYFYTKKNEL